MNFKDIENYLLGLGNEVDAMKLGLENISRLLAELGHPERTFKKVQVAGTNGKGSVCAFLESITLAAGIRTGTFTSPHLVSVTERIRINGVDIGEEEFAEFALRVRETAERLVESGDLDRRPTFFEQITAIALIAFERAGVELAILETGLGGRLDATTAAGAEIAAITRIDLDHQDMLGSTLAEIAGEKAAIISDATLSAVIGEQPGSVYPILNAACRAKGVNCCRANDVRAFFKAGPSSGGEFQTDRRTYKVDSIGLAGRHQVENAKVAILLAEALSSSFTIGDEHVVSGLENARHPGRLERHGRFLFDGAHNSNGASVLAAYLREANVERPTVIFAAMADKNVREMLGFIAPLAGVLVVTQAANSRSSSYEKLIDALPADLTRERVFAADNAASALRIAEAVSPTDATILVTGSLYLIGEMKALLDARAIGDSTAAN